MPVKSRAAQAVGVVDSRSPSRSRSRSRADRSPAIDAADPPIQWGMIYLLARIFYAMRQRTEDALRPHNITPMQFTIMGTLSRLEGLSSAELSRRFHVTPQTMGEMIGNLERRALVVRVQDPSNRRALRLNLTAEGGRLFDLCQAAMHDVEKDMFADMPVREFEALRSRMVNLHAHLGLAGAGE